MHVRANAFVVFSLPWDGRGEQSAARHGAGMSMKRRELADQQTKGVCYLTSNQTGIIRK
jgi:hypothetical protein